jgi:hypothetical protein
MDLEDPELPGEDFLIVLFLIRNCKENGPGGPRGFGSEFLIRFIKELDGKWTCRTFL